MDLLGLHLVQQVLQPLETLSRLNSHGGVSGKQQHLLHERVGVPKYDLEFLVEQVHSLHYIRLQFFVETLWLPLEFDHIEKGVRVVCYLLAHSAEESRVEDLMLLLNYLALLESTQD